MTPQSLRWLERGGVANGTGLAVRGASPPALAATSSREGSGVAASERASELHCSCAALASAATPRTSRKVKSAAPPGLREESEMSTPDKEVYFYSCKVTAEEFMLKISKTSGLFKPPHPPLTVEKLWERGEDFFLGTAGARGGGNIAV